MSSHHCLHRAAQLPTSNASFLTRNPAASSPCKEAGKTLRRTLRQCWQQGWFAWCPHRSTPPIVGGTPAAFPGCQAGSPITDNPRKTFTKRTLCGWGSASARAQEWRYSLDHYRLSLWHRRDASSHNWWRAMRADADNEPIFYPLPSSSWQRIWSCCRSDILQLPNGWFYLPQLQVHSKNINQTTLALRPLGTRKHLFVEYFSCCKFCYQIFIQKHQKMSFALQVHS